MDDPTRKAWSRPELIVLVRGKPEEAVLWACKKADIPAGNANLYGGCFYALCSQVCDGTVGS